MSRAIKFRVWDIKRKRLAYPKELGLYDGMITFGDGGSPRRCDSHECVIEQFTGLKNSSGCEIYEGDIVRWSHPMIDIGVVEYVVDGSPDVNQCFWGVNVARLGGVCAFQSDDEYEVIGNIHEHQHLLNPTHP